MMKHSFAEIDSARHRVDRQEALGSIKENILSLSKKEDCLICMQDIDSYFSACVSVARYTYRIQVSVVYNCTDTLNLCFMITLARKCC